MNKQQEKIVVGRELDALVHEVLGHDVWWSTAKRYPDGWTIMVHPKSLHTNSRASDSQQPIAVDLCMCDVLKDQADWSDEPRVHGHFWNCLAVIPNYHTDMAAAWAGVEQLTSEDRDHPLFFKCTYRWWPEDVDEPVAYAAFDWKGVGDNNPLYQGVGETMPLAICHAIIAAAADDERGG